MNQLYLTAEHNLFREGLRDFLQKEVKPHVDRWEEKGQIDRDIWKKFGEMGYFGINYPEKYGGLELDLFYTLIFLEELQRVHSGGFAAAMWAHTYLAMTHLNEEGDEFIKEKYLVPSITGDKIGCLGISEPFGGSDVAGIRTTARRDGDDWLINGSKTFITNGVYADYMVIAAKTDPDSGGRGISIFVTDSSTDGITTSKLDKLGWRASDTAEIAFDNVRIPSNQLIGAENAGFGYIMQHFSLERLIMGINAHARAEYAMEYASQYMSERSAFGKKLNEFQALRHRFSQLYAEVDMIKSYNYQVIKRLNDGEYVVKEATISKLLSTQIADKVIYECLQFLGGYGYMEEYPLARMFRDSRLGPIGGGTSEILKEILSKILIDKKQYEKKI